MIHDRSIVLRTKGIVIRWVFEFAHDQWLTRTHLLPWALPEAELLPAETVAEYSVGIHLVSPALTAAFRDLKGMKFILGAETEHRYASDWDCHSFVQDPRPNEGPYVHYAPIMCIWAPPVSCPKTRKCSIVESGKYHWRNELIGQASKIMNGVDIFGNLGRRPLAGHHALSSGMGNDKYLAVQEYAFYLSFERALALDYVTEKLNDAIMCEAVPVYRGAPNVRSYCLEEALIPWERAIEVDWRRWEDEYVKRRPHVLQQKEILRTRFNVLAYFDLLVRDLSRLDRARPITIEG